MRTHLLHTDRTISIVQDLDLPRVLLWGLGLLRCFQSGLRWRDLRHGRRHLQPIRGGAISCREYRKRDSVAAQGDCGSDSSWRRSQAPKRPAPEPQLPAESETQQPGQRDPLTWRRGERHAAEQLREVPAHEVVEEPSTCSGVRNSPPICDTRWIGATAATSGLAPRPIEDKEQGPDLALHAVRALAPTRRLIAIGDAMS